MRKLQLLSVLTALAAGFAAPPASAAVAVGHSGWEWDNPVPQGNTIRTLEHAGGVGYAAGDFGTLLKTSDAWASFSGLATGLTEDITVLRPLDADSLVVAGGCALRRSEDGGRSFRRVPWSGSESPCRSPISSVAFPTSEVGYVMREDGRVYRSADGGRTWLRMTRLPFGTGPDDRALAADLFFTAADTGFAATTDGIYRTDDGAFSWTLVAGGRAIKGLHFVGTDAFAVGDGSTVLKSSDGGFTWAPRSLGAGATLALDSIKCSDPLACIVTIERDGRLLRTFDGGLTWLLVRASSEPLFAAGFATPLRVAAAGAEGITVISDDAGATWEAVGGSLPGRFSRLSGRSGSLAFATGERGAVARTTDGGLSWSAVGLPTAELIVDVSFPEDAVGFALDAAGALFRSEDGGITWEARPAAPSFPAEALIALDPDRLLLVGPRGVRRSLDGGQSFATARRKSVRRAVLFDVDYSGGSLFAYGPTALFASRDGGSTWRKLARPEHRPLAAVDFAGARVGFALSKGGRLWRTRDRGRSWHEMLGTGTDGGLELSFSTVRDGYLASRDLFFARGATRPDYVLRTSDAGRSWRPQLVSDSRSITGLLATRDSVDFLLAGGNRLFSTVTGGDRGRRSSLRLRAQRRRLRRPGRAVISGRLAPTEGGEQVVVSMTAADPRRRLGSIDWQYKSARVAADGSFTTRWRLRRTSVFVAQWTGDDERASAGSRTLEVRVREPSRRAATQRFVRAGS